MLGFVERGRYKEGYWGLGAQREILCVSERDIGCQEFRETLGVRGLKRKREILDEGFRERDWGFTESDI